MSFSPDWLALREPHDAAARATGLLERLSARDELAPRRIVDLAAGTGANLRYLAPRLGHGQRWQLIDHDAGLLANLEPALHAWAPALGATVVSQGTELIVTAPGFDCRVTTVQLDLATDLRALELPPSGLVTCSALLDLVSEAWLRELAQRCRDARAAVAFALTYDGRMTPAPADAWDARALALFNRHQRSDKGFGPALGPTATETAVRIFAERGYALTRAASDWQLGAAATRLQAELLDGWLAAALDIEPEHRAELVAWHARRRDFLSTGHATLLVGHCDLVGRPGD